jgi:hypothetical protein
MDLNGGVARPISPEGVRSGNKAVSPDGSLAFGQGPDGVWSLYPIEATAGSTSLPISGLAEDDAPIGWSADSRSLFVQGSAEYPAPVSRVDWRTGNRELFREIWPDDPAGIWGSRVFVTPDGKTSVYTSLHNLSALFLVEGLK